MIHFQYKVATWMQTCFGPAISADKQERNDRFLEEALELVQAGGMPKESALALVDYTFGRPVGDLRQEVGGVMVTLAALCQAHGADMDVEGAIEIDRIDTPELIEKIRAKQKSKPRGSPLPQATTINDLGRQLAQNQSDNLDSYLQAYLKATGLGIEDVTLSQQTFIENGRAGNRYWLERKVRDKSEPLRTLQQKAAALDDWMQRTEWVQEEKATFPFNTLGMHRADVMRRAIDEMRKLVVVPRTDQEIVDETDDLARELARVDGYELDDKFYSCPAPRAMKYWTLACLAQEKLTATDPNDALSNLDPK